MISVKISFTEYVKISFMLFSLKYFIALKEVTKSQEWQSSQ